jgi:hypothetical protein
MVLLNKGKLYCVVSVVVYVYIDADLLATRLAVHTPAAVG